MPSRGRLRQPQPQQMAGWPPNGTVFLIARCGLFLAALSLFVDSLSLNPLSQLTPSPFYHSNKQPLAWHTSWTPREPWCLPMSCTVRAMRDVTEEKGDCEFPKTSVDDRRPREEESKAARFSPTARLNIHPRAATSLALPIPPNLELTPSALCPQRTKNTGGPGGAAYLMPAGKFSFPFFLTTRRFLSHTENE